jgi:hypothetical protein
MDVPTDFPSQYAPVPGHPTILLDSSPPPRTLSSLLAPLHFVISQIRTALTGIVPKPLIPNSLRLIWYLHNGKEHARDYDLFQSSVVGENYDILCEHEEVRRVVIMGYSNQNPWAEGCKEMDAKLRRMKAEARRAKIAQEKSERNGKGAEERDTTYHGDNKTRISVDGDNLFDRAESRENEGESRGLLGDYTP